MVPSTILGGVVIPMISFILMSSLSRACKVCIGVKFATKAHCPLVGGSLPCAETPVRPEMVEAASLLAPLEPLEPLELPDADPVALDRGGTGSIHQWQTFWDRLDDTMLWAGGRGHRLGVALDSE